MICYWIERTTCLLIIVLFSSYLQSLVEHFLIVYWYFMFEECPGCSDRETERQRDRETERERELVNFVKVLNLFQQLISHHVCSCFKMINERSVAGQLKWPVSVWHLLLCPAQGNNHKQERINQSKKKIIKKKKNKRKRQRWIVMNIDIFKTGMWHIWRPPKEIENSDARFCF